MAALSRPFLRGRDHLKEDDRHMKRFYWSMVGQHFPDNLEIQLMAAEIDRRIEWDLPSYYLRERLEGMITSYLKAANESTNKEKKALRYVRRDLNEYHYVHEKSFIVRFLTIDGETYTFDLKTEEVTLQQEWSDKDVTAVAAKFERHGLFERQMIVRLETGELWEVLPESVIPTVGTEILFQLSDQEQQIVLQHTSRMNQKVAKLRREMEELREQLAQTVGIEMKLTQDSVLEVSRQLDLKINEFLRFNRGFVH